MKTLSQRDFKGAEPEFKWATVDKDGTACLWSLAPVYFKHLGKWAFRDCDIGAGRAYPIGTGYLFGQVVERKTPWWRRLFTAWLDAVPTFSDADRYRFARDVMFDNQLWEVWSAIRFAERYDFDAERYDACIDKAMAECIERGIWK